MLEKQKAEWKSDYVEYKTRRTGVLAMKTGMVRLYDALGNSLPITVLKMEDVTVIQQRTQAQNGYTALQLGAGPIKAKHVSMPRLGEFAKFDVECKRHIEEFRVSPDALLPVGTRIDVRHFIPGQKIDICGVTIGKGFQGVMKRWGFSGFPGSHGTSKAHRSAGSTGCRQDPGKVWPGKKMAGRMGNRQRTVQNVRLVAIDPIRELLFCYGQVPGKAGSYVRVTDAIKLPTQFREKNLPLPFPTFDGPKAEATEDGTGPDNWIFDDAFTASTVKDTGGKPMNPQKASAKSSK
jgi:large subunit ribosomal protein L3